MLVGRSETQWLAVVQTPGKLANSSRLAPRGIQIDAHWHEEDQQRRCLTTLPPMLLAWQSGQVPAANWPGSTTSANPAPGTNGGGQDAFVAEVAPTPAVPAIPAVSSGPEKR